MTAPRFVAYYRVSTGKQGRSGLGLEAQRAAVQAHVAAAQGIVARRAGAVTLRELADALAARGVPTPAGRGARWRPTQVARVLGRYRQAGVAPTEATA